MANKKTDVPVVSVLVGGLGMGMGMAALQMLTEEIVANGGFENESRWQIPRSLMECLSAEWSVKRYHWFDVLNRKDCPFSVPIVRFGDPEEFKGQEMTPIPQEIADQIIGKRATYPMIIMWQNEPYVVVYSLTVGDELEEGKIFNPDRLYGLWLAPAKYFNLER